MARWKIGWTCIALCFVTFVASAETEIKRGRGEIGIDFGFANLDSKYGDDGGRALLRGGYHVTDRFQLEGQTGGSFTNCSDQGCTDLHTWLVNGVLSFHPRPNVAPYVLAGAGYADRPDFTFSFPLGPLTLTETVEGGTSAAFQVAAGLRFFYGRKKKAAVRLEVSGLREDTFEEASTHLHVMTGLLWRIGKGR